MTGSHIQTNAPAALAPKPRAGRTKATKTATVLKMLRSKRGASVEQLRQATGWQSHSVRGFLSGTVRRKMGLTLIAATGKDGLKRYHIEQDVVGE